MLLTSPFYRKGNWGCKQWSNMPEYHRVSKWKPHDLNPSPPITGAMVSRHYNEGPAGLLTHCPNQERCCAWGCAWPVHSWLALAWNPGYFLSLPMHLQSRMSPSSVCHRHINQPATHAALGASEHRGKGFAFPAPICIDIWVMSLFF